MSDTQSGPNTLDIEGWGCYSVIAVSFEDDDNAYAALTRIKELDSQHQVAVGEAIVVVRELDGRVIERTGLPPSVCRARSVADWSDCWWRSSANRWEC